MVVVHIKGHTNKPARKIPRFVFGLVLEIREGLALVIVKIAIKGSATLYQLIHDARLKFFLSLQRRKTLTVRFAGFSQGGWFGRGEPPSMNFSLMSNTQFGVNRTPYG